MNSRTILILTTAIQIATSVAATAVPAISPLVASELAVPTSWIGIYTSLLYGGAAISAVYSGANVHRLGGIRASRGALVLCAVGLALIATCRVPLVAVGAVLLGLGYGPITPASSYILSKVTPPKYRSLMFSIKQSGVPAGAALAAFTFPFGAIYLGLPATFMLGAVACVAMALVTFRFSSDIDTSSHNSSGLEKNPRSSFRLLATVPRLRALAAVAFIFGGLQVSLIAMLVPFLHEQCNMSVPQAASMLALSSGVGLVFRLVWGYVVDQGVPAMKLLGSLGLLGAAGFLVLALSNQETAPLLIALAVCMLGSAVIAWNGVALAEVATSVEPHDVAAATCVCLLSSFVGVVTVPLALSLALSSSGFNFLEPRRQNPDSPLILATRRHAAMHYQCHCETGRAYSAHGREG